MMKRFLFCLFLLTCYVANAQYLPLNDAYNGDVNSSNLNFAGKLYGAQNAQDNYGSFLSFGTNSWTLQFNGSTQAERDVYVRQNGYGGIAGVWYKLWHSGNFNPSGYFKFGSNPYIAENGTNFLEGGSYNGYTYLQSQGSQPLNLNPLGNAIVIPQSNVGIGTMAPSYYFHGGNNKVVEILNPETGINSQSHIVLSTGATSNFGSVGSLSFVAANSTNNKGVAYVAATLTSDATANASGALVFATANANTPLERMRINYTGNVGIGTSAPSELLHLQGQKVGIRFNPDFQGEAYIYTYAENAYQPLNLQASKFTVATNGSENFVVNATGNVGIGTTTPTEKLAVNGNIRTRKVIVTQTGWPDYVFDSSYQLPSLDSVSSFIQANKHLPDMPSAAVVEKDGHDLGEVQKLLLKKMEEMTLYIIKQDEKIKEQGNKIEALERKLTNTSK